MRNRFARILVSGALLCAVGLCLQTPVRAQSAPAADAGGAAAITGLAILGDSTQDEYHADSARGGDFAATTFNWVELLATERNVNVGPWGAYREPRRSGFAYNWARSGASSAQMLTQGQLAGALGQILDKEVSHAIIQIGINDLYLSGVGYKIYDGDFAGTAGEAELQSILDKTARNIFITAYMLQALGTNHVILAAVQDYVTLPVIPEIQTSFTDPDGRLRVIEAFAYINRHLAELSAAWGISFFDYNAAMLAELNGRLDGDGYLVVGDTRINLSVRGNDPRFGMLDDEYAHPGTVLSGLSANVYIAEMNRVFGTTIAPLSDAEILQAAGLQP